MTTTKLERQAEDPKRGMTRIELSAFMALCEGNKVSPNAIVTAVVGWHGQVKSIKVTVEENPR